MVRKSKIRKVKMKVRRVRKPKVLKKGRIRRVKQSKRGLRLDKKRKALPAGKRMSKSGHIYYEYRSTHAD